MVRRKLCLKATVLTFVQTVLLIKTSYSVPLTDSLKTNAKRSLNPAASELNFLKKFGYLESSGPETLYAEDAFINAIKKVQLFGGLNLTGDLNNETIQLMKSKRCGVPDIDRTNRFNGSEVTYHTKQDHNKRVKRFLLGSEGWNKREITYYIKNWSPKLTENEVATELQRAFDKWGRYGRLTFKRIFNEPADIIVKFGVGHHGDPYPFDGQGLVLAHAFLPTEGDALGGDIHFDDDEQWTVNSEKSYDGVDFFAVAIHELGHSLGLGHSSESGSIMNPYYKGSHELGNDDVLAMYKLYATRYSLGEDNFSSRSSTLPSVTKRTQPVYPTSTEHPNYPHDNDDVHKTTTERPNYSHSNDAGRRRPPEYPNYPHGNDDGGIRPPEYPNYPHGNDNERIRPPKYPNYSHNNDDGRIRPPEYPNYPHANDDGRIRPPEYPNYPHGNDDGRIRPPEYPNYPHGNDDGKRRPEYPNYPHGNDDGRRRPPEYPNYPHGNDDGRRRPTEYPNYPYGNDDARKGLPGNPHRPNCDDDVWRFPRPTTFPPQRFTTTTIDATNKNTLGSTTTEYIPSISTTTKYPVEKYTPRRSFTTNVPTVTNSIPTTGFLTYLGDDEHVHEHMRHMHKPSILHVDEKDIKKDTVTSDTNTDCDIRFDAAGCLRGELFFFHGKKLWRLKEPKSVIAGYPVEFIRFFHNLPENFDKIDAIYERPTDSNIIMFSGRDYLVFDGNKVVDESTRPITEYGLPRHILKVDAVASVDYITYIFSDERVWAYNETSRTIESENRINSMFPGIPNNLDSTLTWNNGELYFFKGNKYWMTRHNQTLQLEYSRSICDYWLDVGEHS